MRSNIDRIARLQQAAAQKAHGTRARYVAGKCRCMLCRAANSRYSTSRQHAIDDEGDRRNLVSASRARAYVQRLQSRGIGHKAVADAASITHSNMWKIVSGRREFIRADTERRILAVDGSCVADGARIAAHQTWKLIDELLDGGWTKSQLARLLGMQTPSLQINRKKVRAITASKVQRLYNMIQEGRIQRDRDDRLRKALP